MDKVGEAAASGGGGYPDIRPVLQGGGTLGPTIWFKVMCDGRHNEQDGVGKTKGAHPSDHR